MEALLEFLRRLNHLRRRGQFGSVLDEEIRFHIESRAAELEEEGLSHNEALIQARREFGAGARVREESRDAWRFGWLEDFVTDIGYAARSIRRNRGFSLAAVACLTVGIGVNTTIFSLTMELLFSQPSLTKPDRLVTFRVGGSSHSALPIYRFVEQAKPFEEIGGWSEGQVNWRLGEDSYRLFSVVVSDNLFEMVGIPVSHGRGLQKGDEDAVVLTNPFWRGRLDANPNIVGRTLVLDGRSHTVVGILPPGHRTLTGFGFTPDVYLPVTSYRSQQNLAFLARLPEGMTPPQAVRKLALLGAELDRIHANEPPSYGQGNSVDPLIGPARLKAPKMMQLAAFFGLLLIVVAFVLLIACINVSSLLLARSFNRAPELAMRRALGAGRGRLVRQLLTETSLLAFLGTLAGLGLNLLLTNWISGLQLPLPVPIRLEIAPDWRLLAYASAVMLAATLMAGLLPALQFAHSDLHSSLKLQEYQVMGKGLRLRNVLVAGQLALSVVLLTTGFLFVRNLFKASQLDVGFDLTHTTYARMDVVAEQYREGQRTQSLIDSALEELRSLPGVRSASFAQVVPFEDAIVNGAPIRIEGSDKGIPVRFNGNFVSPDYFASMGIRLLDGRDFQTADSDATPAIAILNENLTRDLFGSERAIGRRIYLFRGDRKEEELLVVGVVDNSKYATIGEDRPQAMYRPFSGSGNSQLHFVIRAAGAPATILGPVRQVLSRLDPAAAVEVKPLRDSMGLALVPSQIGAGLLGSIGVMGLLLASIGLHGVLSYGVSRRTREIGLRAALGASSGQVLRLVMRSTGAVLSIGVGIGLGLAFLAAQPLAMFLVPEIKPSDPLNYAVVALVLGIVGVIASLGPALRALGVDPITALRHE